VSLITLVVLLVAGLVIARQFRPRPMRAVPMVAVPLVLAALGAQALLAGPRVGDAGIAILAFGAVVAAILGLLRGRSERLWTSDAGAVLRQGTRLTALLWLAALAVRVATVPVEHAVGDHVAVGAQLELLLGLSLAAQHAVLFTRRATLVDGPVAGRRRAA
jgi:hypothetical protein